MNYDDTFFETTSAEFLELASELRLKILYNLIQKKYRLTTLAKRLNVTAQELHRNLDRMLNAGLVAQDKDGTYQITTFGKAIVSQLPSIAFLSNHKEYFESHNFGNIPSKFVRRIGELDNSEYIDGVSRVLEKWKSLYKNSNEYIFTILSETPLDLMELIIRKIKKGVRYKHIISEKTPVPKGRKKLLSDMGFYPLLEQGKIERRMLKHVDVMMVVNETEAAIMFSSENGDADLRGMFVSKDPQFHEWCIDYFRYSWNISDPFKEFKLKE